MNIVIVDAESSTRQILRRIVQDIDPQFGVHDFGEPGPALRWCDQNPPDLLLLDYRMPGMDGVQLAKALRRNARNCDVPIVMVSVVGEERIRQAALDAGAIDFMVKPIRARELGARCRNLLQWRRQSKSAKQRALALERRLLASMHRVEERERETLSRLTRAMELRDTGTGACPERMAGIAGMIAGGLGLPEGLVRTIELTAPLHDIGKIAIPDTLLRKPAALDDDERKRMQLHPVIGYELLQDSRNPFLQVGAMIARHHHERHDGTGYPDGLCGDEIPIEARVVAVAEILDALTLSALVQTRLEHGGSAGVHRGAERQDARSGLRAGADGQPAETARDLRTLLPGRATMASSRLAG